MWRYWRENLRLSYWEWGRHEVGVAFVLYLIGGAIAAISPDLASEPVVVRILAGMGLMAAAHFLFLVFVLTPMKMYREGTSGARDEEAIWGQLSEGAQYRFVKWEHGINLGNTHPSSLAPFFSELHAAGLLDSGPVGKGQRVVYTRLGSQVYQWAKTSGVKVTEGAGQ